MPKHESWFYEQVQNSIHCVLVNLRERVKFSVSEFSANCMPNDVDVPADVAKSQKKSVYFMSCI